MRLVTFDVFDTLLTRTVAVPKDLFLAVGEEIRRRSICPIDPKRFGMVRVEAEITSRQLAPGGEPSLEEIYAILGSQLQWPVAMMSQVLRLELAAEETALRAVPGMRERVRLIRKDADRLVFLSDMYLPVAFIRSVLKREGFFQEGDEILVSSEFRKSKASGMLFHELRERIGLVKQWQHVGDNPHSDVAVPRRMGIVAEEFSCTRLNGYERLVRGTDQGAATLARIPPISGPEISCRRISYTGW